MMCPLGTVNVLCFTNKDKQIGLGLHVYSIVKCSFIPCLIVTYHSIYYYAFACKSHGSITGW